MRLRPRGAHAIDRALVNLHIVSLDLEGRVLDKLAQTLRAGTLTNAKLAVTPTLFY